MGYYGYRVQGMRGTGVQGVRGTGHRVQVWGCEV